MSFVKGATIKTLLPLNQNCHQINVSFISKPSVLERRIFRTLYEQFQPLHFHGP